MAFLLQLQVSALLLNLLPLPPLDGFQAIAPWLPRALSDRLYAVSNQALFILFLAMWYIRPLNMAFWDVVDAGTALLGAHPAWGRMGWREFRFWE
jgi:Zn-dependent protease